MMADDRVRGVGSRFGHYELRALLGRGGMGEVYSAYDTRKDRTVALKVLPPDLAGDPAYQDRFRREARTAARLQEPHVIPIHDFGEIDGLLYIDMRLVKGRDLKSVMRKGGALQPEYAVGIVSQIASALEAAHVDGLVHRDIKPANILVMPSGFAYLADFGIASRGADTRTTGEGGALGSLPYMAPERFGDLPATVESDVYALSCVLFECLTGTTPFGGRDVEAVVNAHRHSPRPSVQPYGVAAAFDPVVARGMDPLPQRRFRSAGALGRAAQDALRRSGGAGSPDGTTADPQAGRMRALPAHPEPTGPVEPAPMPVARADRPVRPMPRQSARAETPSSDGQRWLWVLALGVALIAVATVALWIILG